MWWKKELKYFNFIVTGLNEDVLKNLLKVYVNAPVEREGIELRPYLDPQCSVVADIQDPKRRVFLENLFKYLNSNRLRHRPLPEIWDWEYIYKIRFKTRPMDARRRFFELWQNPWARRLDDHSKKYVPKAVRTNKKEKFEPTYYP